MQPSRDVCAHGVSRRFMQSGGAYRQLLSNRTKRCLAATFDDLRCYIRHVASSDELSVCYRAAIEATDSQSLDPVSASLRHRRPQAETSG